MAISLSFIWHDHTGDTTLMDLGGGSGNGRTFGFTPVPAQAGDPFVTQTIDGYILNADSARSKINALAAGFAKATEDSRRRLGRRLYCSYKPTQSDTAFYAEVIGGTISPIENQAADYENASAQRFTITFQMRPWWQRSTAAALTLTNGAGSGTTQYAQNQYNGAAEDPRLWFSAISGTDVATPLQLTFTNALTKRLKTVYVGMMRNESSNYDPRAVLSTGGSSVSINNATGVTFAKWAISSAKLARMQGRPFKPALRTSAVLTPTDMDAKWTIQYTTGGTDYVLFQTDWQRMPANKQLFVFESMPFPPTTLSTYTPLDLDLVCTMRKASSSQSVTADGLQLMPAEQFRTYLYTTFTAGQNDKLAHDPYEDFAGTYINASAKYVQGSLSVAPDEPLMAWPNDAPMLMVLHDYSDGTSASTDSLAVNISARARRAAI